jgi:hypothetical protein
MTAKLFCGAVLMAAAEFAWAGIITQANACLGVVGVGAGRQCSGAPSGTLASGGESLGFTDYATATFGTMHIGASVNILNLSNDQAYALGFDSVQDHLTIDSPSQHGQIGHLVVTYYIDGTISNSGGIADAFLQVVTRILPNTDFALQNSVEDDNTSVPAGTHTVPVVFNFRYGSPFDLYFSMQATAGTMIDLSGSGYQLKNRTGSGMGAVDFTNTWVLNGLGTTDSLGNPVMDSTFSADSGTPYTQDGVAPEPATLVLSGAAMLAFGFIRPKVFRP